MAGRALAGRAVVAHGGRSKCTEAGMADVARLGGRNVVGRFGQAGASGDVAARAAKVAAHGDAVGSVIEDCRRPSRSRRVTGIALLGGRDVVRRLHLRVLIDVGTAMTSRAPTSSTGVIHIGGRERCGRMANVAGRCRRDVRRGLLRGAIRGCVASLAGAGRYSAVVVRGVPRIGHVAGVARGIGRGIGEVVAAFAARKGVVVAIETGTRSHVGVVKGCANPGQRVVTGIARSDYLDVRGWFTRGQRSVMAGSATSPLDILMGEHDDVPIHTLMAGVALLTCSDWNVLERELGGVGATCIAVAGVAVPRGTPEHTLDVAGLAAGRDVLVIEEEAGRGVIELGIAAQHALRQSTAAAEHQKCQQDVPSLAEQSSE